MKVAGKQMRSIWLEADGVAVGVIDQTLLPHRFATIRLETLQDAARAIVTMQVRGVRHLARPPPTASAWPCGMTRPTNSGARLRDAARNASDRDQPEMGARRDGGCGTKPPTG